jgi:hypothetical protein
VSVHIGGAYVVSFFVNATADNEPWNVKSGNFSSGKTNSVQVPVDAVDITLIVHGERFINDWDTILKQEWKDTSTWPSTGLAYKTSGTADDMHCEAEG